MNKFLSIRIPNNRYIFNMARSRLPLFFALLAFYQLHLSCHYCVVTENPEVRVGQSEANTCRSSMFVSAEDTDTDAGDDQAKADASSFYEEVLSEFQRGKPTSPPSEEEDHVERWSQRVMNLRRKDLALEQHDGNVDEESIDVGPVIVNHFDLLQFPPRRILSPMSAEELAKEELQSSIMASCPCSENMYVPQEGGTRFAYLITVHNYRTAEDATYLYRALRDTGHPGAAPIILIHIDLKFSWQDFKKSSLYHEISIKNCTCSSLTYVTSIYDCQWSKWSMNYPTHWAMRILINDVKFRGKWDVFINLSGDSMPTLSQKSLSDLHHPIHGPLRNINFVTSSACETGLVPTNIYEFPTFWHKRKHYMDRRKARPTITYVDYSTDADGNIVGKEKTINVTVHFGSQWMSLQYDFVEYIVTSLNRTDSFPFLFREWLKNTRKLMTDETFIPTILMNVYPFNATVPRVNRNGTLTTLPNMHAVRYERMDEHMPSAFGFYPLKQRYEVSNYSLADKPKTWGPYFLGIYDLADIKHSGALFIRKVSMFVDSNIVQILPVESLKLLPEIQWPATHLKVSSTPDWARELEEIRASKNTNEKHDVALR